jgi:hypothetical protein
MFEKTTREDSIVERSYHIPKLMQKLFDKPLIAQKASLIENPSLRRYEITCLYPGLFSSIIFPAFQKDKGAGDCSPAPVGEPAPRIIISTVFFQWSNK